MTFGEELVRPPKPWLVAGATTAGVSHTQNGKPNQDAFDYCNIHGKFPVTVLAVADGAGSAPNSDEGSQLAVATAVAEVKKAASRQRRNFFQIMLRNRQTARHIMLSLNHRSIATPTNCLNLLRYAINRAQTAIFNHAEARGVPPRAYATTLLLAVATPHWIAAAQIGDGAIVATNPETGAAITLCQSHGGEYANETLFITTGQSPGNTAAHTGWVTTDQYNSVGMITDGLEKLALKMSEREPIPGFWEPMIRWLHEDGPEETTDTLQRFIQSDRVRARSGDDLTILVAAASR